MSARIALEIGIPVVILLLLYSLFLTYICVKVRPILAMTTSENTDTESNTED